MLQQVNGYRPTRRAERLKPPPLLIQDFPYSHPDQGLGHPVHAGGIERVIAFRGFLGSEEELDALEFELQARNAKRVTSATATFFGLLISEEVTETTFGTCPSGTIPPCSTTT